MKGVTRYKALKLFGPEIAFHMDDAVDSGFDSLGSPLPGACEGGGSGLLSPGGRGPGAGERLSGGAGAGGACAGSQGLGVPAGP